MSDILSLRVESWHDHRFVDSIRREISSRPDWDAAFDPRSTVVYRVPLPNAERVRIHFQASGQRPESAPRILEMDPDGRRAYVVDSAPFSVFAKPVLLFVFDGQATRPVEAIRNDWFLFMDDRVFPFFDPRLLNEWRVAGPGEGPLPERLAGPPPFLTEEDLGFGAPGPPQFLATLAPLSGPFPPRSVPIPKADPPPEIGTGAADDCAGQGVRLFFGLNFQAPQLKYDPSGKASLDDMLFETTKKVAQAFADRGYTTAVAQAGMTSAKTCAAMIEWLKTGLAQHPEFCQSPCDQLVIYISAHGGSEDISFDPSGTGYAIEDVGYGQLMDLLAGIAALTGDPQKVYLIFDLCNSGTVWSSPTFPLALRGMHVITSTPGAGASSVVYQTTLFVEALKNANVHSWDDLLRWLAWTNLTHKWPPTAGEHPQWANGDIDGCAASLQLISVVYEGDDVGIVVYQVTTPQGAEFMKGTSHGQTDNPHHQMFPLRFSTKCFEPLRIRVSFEISDPPAPPGFKERIKETIDTLCDGNNGEVVKIVSAGPQGGKKAQLKFKFELKTEC